jgi:hypothetical protein
MTLIRAIEIENLRSVRALTWHPCEGVNCLIGPGDSGKSTVLDAIDYCIGARRSVALTDSDFCSLDMEKPVRIAVTLGALPDELKSIDNYGLYLRGYNAATGDIEPEPKAGLETVQNTERGTANPFLIGSHGENHHPSIKHINSLACSIIRGHLTAADRNVRPL